MKTIYYLLIAIFFSGCASMKNGSLSNKAEDNDTKFLIEYKDNIQSIEKYNLFSYKVPYYESRLLMGVYGRLEWSENCLVFIPKDTSEKVTPLFPVQSTKISSDGSHLSVSGNNFAIGSEVILGGDISNTSDIRINFFTKGQSKCLFTKTLSII